MSTQALAATGCSSSDEKTQDEATKCICLEEIDAKEDPLLMTLKCGHSYHTKCIGEWIIEHGTCPYCRRHDGFERVLPVPERVEPGVIIRDPCFSLESLNLIMQFIVAIHVSELGIMVILNTLLQPNYIFYFHVIALGLRWIQIFLQAFSVVASIIYTDMLYKEKEIYKPLGNPFSGYVSELYRWSFQVLCYMVLRLVLAEFYCIPSFLAIVFVDFEMFVAWRKSDREIYTTLIYTRTSDFNEGDDATE